MIFTYLLQLLLIGGLALFLFWCYYAIMGVHRAKVEQRLFLADLTEKVKLTTPEKDAQLRELHKNNKKALAIINDSEKENLVTLRSVESMEQEFSFSSSEEEDNIFTLDRREQLSRHLDLKRARRMGEVKQKTAKILDFNKIAEK